MAPLYEEHSIRRMRFLQKITAKTKIQPKKLIMRSIISINFFFKPSKILQKITNSKNKPLAKKITRKNMPSK